MAGAGHFNPEAAPLKRLFAEMPEPVRLLRPRRRERPSVRPASPRVLRRLAGFGRG